MVARLIPPTTGLRVAFAAAVLFLAASGGFLVGSTVGGSERPAADSVDVGFLRDMITHHEQALQLSSIELQTGAEPSIRVFAREILLTQSYELGAMERQLEHWGYSPQDRPQIAMAWMQAPTRTTRMPGLASDEEMGLLTASRGRDVDALFTPLMQDHHRGGVHMASFAAQEASTAFVRELAARMERNQRAEIGELEQARVRAGLPAAPAGYRPAVIPRDHAVHAD